MHAAWWLLGDESATFIPVRGQGGWHVGERVTLQCVA
jgi:hypothetical protein